MSTTAPTKPQTSDAAPAVNTHPVPPGPDAAAKFASAAREFVEAWSKHVEHFERRVETPFPRAFAPTSEVLDAIIVVSMALGDVLVGSRSPEALVRAAAVIVDTPEEGDLRTQARQRRAIDLCTETLDAMHALRDDVESGRLDPVEAVDKEKFYTRALVSALVGIHPGFKNLRKEVDDEDLSRTDLEDERVKRVRSLFALPKRRRSNASGMALLFELMMLADVWPGTGIEALKKAQRKK